MKRIALVEDDPDKGIETLNVLRGTEHSIALYTDRGQLLAEMRRAEGLGFHAVVTNVGEEGGGIDLVRDMREIQFHPDLVALYHTGHSNQSFAALAQSKGVRLKRHLDVYIPDNWTSRLPGALSRAFEIVETLERASRTTSPVA